MALSLRFLVACSLLSASSWLYASDCFILVHGHSHDGSIKQNAWDYWYQTDMDYLDGRVPRDLIADLTGGISHFGIVGYNALDGQGAYWDPRVAGSVAEQIIAISNGEGDSLSHDRQCRSDDDIYVVAHSRGAQVMAYIAGNADPSDPYYNTTISAAFSQATMQGSHKHCDYAISSEFTTCYYQQVDTGNMENAFSLDSLQQKGRFDEAMSRVIAIFSLSGAINGTQGVDRLCNGTWLDKALLGLMYGDRQCADVASLQTLAIYNPSTYTGASLRTPMFLLGGTGSFPFPLSLTSTKLNGEDDGFVNLASQMNCAGSAKRELEANLSEYRYWRRYFTCDNQHKRHVQSTYNLLITNDDHDSSRNMAKDVRQRQVADMPTCGGTAGGMALAIKSCIGTLSSGE